MTRSHRRSLLLLAAAAATGVVAWLAAPAEAGPASGTAAPPSAHPRAGHDVSANLFEWNWPSVGRECTQVLGPAGYGSVQVAPPADSLQRQHLGDGSDTVLHPWWEVYQPADYRLTSRMGSPAQFRQMVRDCRSAGVDVIVDAVINHMTGQGDTSYGGVHYSKYQYTGLYGPSDFHASPADCPVAPDPATGSQAGTIADFNDYTQVFHCELVGLSDLRTESPKVRRTIAGYLNGLLADGVSGFRVDAAKHIGQPDLAAIERLLHDTVDGRRPFVALEVMPGSPGRLAPGTFAGQGMLLGFDYADQLQTAFKSYNNPPNDGNIGSLRYLGQQSGLLPSKEELVFVENHDTERNGSTLSYKDASNTLANEFMLAWPHGTPQVYASFAWGTADDSPPATADGRVTDTNCSDGTWVCVDRYPGVVGMVGFHDRVAGAPVTDWWDDGTNAVAFSRAGRGFFAGNNETASKHVAVRTDVRPGTYCDVVHGRVDHGRCTGPTVTVARSGFVTTTVAAHDAVAFTAADRLR